MKIITIDRDPCLQQPRCTRREVVIPGLLPHISRMGTAVVQDWAWQEHQQKIQALAGQCPAEAIEVQE